MKKYGYYYRGRRLAIIEAKDFWDAVELFMKQYGYSLYKGDIIEEK